MTAEIAIYDLDRTITRSGTYTPFLLFWARRHAPWRLLLAPLAGVCMAAYAAKFISRKKLKELMQVLMMGARTDAARLAPAADAFAARTVSDGVYARAFETIAADRAAGRRIVLATAAHEFYVAAIARELGVADVVATRSVWDADGALTARIAGANCYGASKLAMIEAFLDRAGVDRSGVRVRFYSDHVSDMPVFEWADEPVAVNPSARLKAVAEARGWPVLDWGAQSGQER